LPGVVLVEAVALVRHGVGAGLRRADPRDHPQHPVRGAGSAHCPPARRAAGFGDLVSDVDRARLTGEFADYLAESFRTALQTGTAGWRDDDVAFVTDWGFRLDDGQVPVAVWQGGQDRMVPYAHGEWLAEHVAGAEPHLLPDEESLSLAVGAVEEIIADLVRLSR
jgi:pimeloyl-ACP methyl ester carboxylesterase